MSTKIFPSSNPERRTVIRRTLVTTVALAALVTGTVCVNSAQDGAVASLTSSVDHSKLEVHAITAASPERVALIAAVNAQIVASTGKVLDPAIIAAAKAQTAKSGTIVTGASKLATSATATITAGVAASKNAFPSSITANAEKIRAIQIQPTIKALAGSDADLVKTIAALNAAANAWTAEQARIATEKAAAASAAAASASRTSAAVQATPRTAAPRSSAPAPAPSSGASKMAIAQGVFARFGFGGVNYNSSLGAGHYAATDLDNQVIYVHLDMIPIDRVASVCIHEYMHILQAREFGGYAQTVAHFGSVLGMEQAADRAARANGATWFHYI